MARHQRTARAVHYHLPVLIEQDEDGVFIVSVPTLRGCRSAGRTCPTRPWPTSPRLRPSAWRMSDPPRRPPSSASATSRSWRERHPVDQRPHAAAGARQARVRSDPLAGSHRRLAHPDGRKTTVPVHRGHDIRAACCGRL